MKNKGNNNLPQSEKKLFDLVTRLKNIYDISPGLICIANANDGIFIECNPAVTSILGWSVKEFTSKPFKEFIHPDDWQSTVDEITEQLKGKSVANFENRYRCKDGSYKWLAWQATVSDKNGKVYAVATDVTERKQAEEELVASLKESERFRDALDKVPAYVYIKDTESTYLYANQSTLKLFGVSAEELVGYKDSKFFPPKTVKHLHQIDSRVFLGEQTDEEIESKDAHGERQVYLEVKTPLYSETKKEIVGLLGISTDITERIRAEEKLKSRNKELEIWAEVTTDRELFMLDLKKEINELLKKSGEKPKYKIPT